ncbi:MAG: FkbM family methyltransferase [Bacteroidota bacterium]
MLKPLAKRIFSAMGLEVRQKSGRRASMTQSLYHLAKLGFKPDVIIDVGTAYGTEQLLEVYPDVRYLWIEALKEFEPTIQQLANKYTGDYLISAAGSEEGEISIHVHDALTGSSVYEEEDGQEADGKARTIPMTTLDAIKDRYKLDQSSLLKIDVQGAELEVLKGAKSILPSCEVILLEVSLFQFQKGAPEFYDIVAYLKEIGYVVYDLVDGHNRPYDGALAQKDLVFVKENGRFRTSHKWASENETRLATEKNNQSKLNHSI